MSINVGCALNNCTLIDGKQVSVINVTVADEPAQELEQHWIWSVIGRPTVQAAITGPGNYAFVNWSSIFNIDLHVKRSASLCVKNIEHRRIYLNFCGFRKN